MSRSVKRSHAQWEAIHKRWSASGLPIGEFCATEGISYQSFYGYRKRRNSATELALSAPPSAEPAFIDLSSLCQSAQERPTWHITLRLCGGVELELSTQP